MLRSRCTFTLSIYSVRRESLKSSSATRRWARGCVRSPSPWPVWVTWHPSFTHTVLNTFLFSFLFFFTPHMHPLTLSRLRLPLMADSRYCSLTFFAVHDDRDHRQEGALPPGIHGHVGQHGAAHRRALLPGESPAKKWTFVVLFSIFLCTFCPIKRDRFVSAGSSFLDAILLHGPCFHDHLLLLQRTM